jgi:epoxyqueuosine reductase
VTLTTTALTAAIKQRATQLGFLACGIARLEPSRRAEALEAWLARGYAGTMRYLHRQARKRKQPAEIVPGARVAVMVLERYPGREGPHPSPGSLPDDSGGARAVRIAKYARGRDYHLALGERLRALAAFCTARGARIARPFVDAGPVPERELAERAGLGWIGKNTMLIRPGVGSFFFIGSVFTDLDLLPDPAFRIDHCGTCTRCLDACPTGALVEPRVLDATRCLSYLTIEQRGPIPEEIVPRLNGWAFGCDICNDVCPWNERFASPEGPPEYAPRSSPPVSDPEYFERMDAATFRAQFGDTPLERAGLEGMRRNWRAAFASLEASPPPALT